ncbi:hypothetical protein MRX96_025745 [Rhipicephalus microplus]
MYWSPQEGSRSPGDGGTPARAALHFVIRPSSAAAGRPLGSRTAVLPPETPLPPVLFELPPRPKEEEPVKQKQRRRRKKRLGKKSAKRGEAVSQEEVPAKSEEARSGTGPKFASAANVRNAGSAIDPPAPGSKQAAEPQVLSRLRAASPRCPKSPSGPPPKAGDVAQQSRDIVSKSPLTSDRVSEKSHDASHDKNSQPPGGSTGAVLKDTWSTSGQSVPYLIAAFVVLCVAVILITALTLRSTKYGKPILAWVLRENETRRFPVPLPKRRQEDARGTTAVTTEKNSFS